ncbi:MAG: hypothetical protein Kow0098_00170 [Ignavibacteriaceae bacterium]
MNNRETIKESVFISMCKPLRYNHLENLQRKIYSGRKFSFRNKIMVISCNVNSIIIDVIRADNYNKKQI